MQNEMSIYKRVQFTAFDYNLHSGIAFKKEYIDFEYVSTGLSIEIICYGYQKQTPPNKDGGHTYEWVTRKEYEDRRAEQCNKK